MMSVYDILEERGYIEQNTHETELREVLEKKNISFYIGFDPTADSLHVGHFVQVMVMMHMQKAGHRPIALLGGGTGMVGDPSGRSDLRQVMTTATIDQNCENFKNQLSRFIDFSEGKAICVNNADWLRDLKYIDFLREVGSQFSVNRMLTAECFKSRMEHGLSFLEFNYMLMQSYDFLELYRRYDCQLQLGGNDQWSNILGGVDLVRRLDQGQAFGMTFKLLATSEGTKMGKTAKGALWIDEEKTTPYEFYHYWRNIADADVENCLALLTFLPMDEVHRLGALQDSKINEAKEILAFEITKLIHGEEKAKKAEEAERALFSKNGAVGEVPSVEMSEADFKDGMNILDVYIKVGLISSKGDGRRLIQQNGIKIKGTAITDFNYMITLDDFEDGKLLLQKGKKAFKQIMIQG
ncbi:MAG: tyrosine--tRNA ligase [Clostridiales bacterium]